MTRVYDIDDMLDRIAGMEQENILLREALSALITAAQDEATWVNGHCTDELRAALDAAWAMLEAGNG